MKIDTGVADYTVRSVIPDWFQDLMPDNATDEQLAHDYAYHLVGALGNPKKMDTVRKHFLQQFSFMHFLAGMHPTVFDELVCAYAEMALTLD
jgi:hypothetical protein